MNRRGFNKAVAATAALALSGRSAARGPGRSERTVLYSGVGDNIMQYDVDVEDATLTPRASIMLPSAVQYAWPHPSRRYLYVSTSDAVGGSRTITGHIHRLCALRIGGDGALAIHGEPQVLAQRPINNSVDHRGAYALTCYNTVADVTVHPIHADGTLGAQLVQAAKLDTGIFPHQVRVTPSNHSVVLVTRGNNAGPNKPEDPGALKLYKFHQGQLSSLASIAVGGKGGYGYGPRHLDFHPSKPWVYVSLERQNQLHMHRIEGDSFAAEPSFIRSTTSPAAPGEVAPLAGPIHVHPDGHTVYVTNRASSTVEWNGRQVFRGGENSIAVFSIDQATGEPTLVQHIDPQGFHVRAFSIDPTGRLLIAATMTDMWVRENDSARHVPAGLSLFRIAPDGRLAFLRKHDVALPDGAQQVWVTMIALPA